MHFFINHTGLAFPALVMVLSHKISSRYHSTTQLLSQASAICQWLWGSVSAQDTADVESRRYCMNRKPPAENGWRACIRACLESKQKECNLIPVCEGTSWGYTREVCISESDNSFLILSDSPLLDAGIAYSNKRWCSLFVAACYRALLSSALEINEFKMEV